MSENVIVYSSDDRIFISHLKNVLILEGINCFIKNDLAYTLAGEVPVNEVWPELWITDKNDLAAATELIAELIKPQTGDNKDWVCSQCGERHEAQFSTCWNCGAEKNI